MPKKQARPANARPTRGSVHSAAHLRDLDREITRKENEIRAAKAAARESRLEAGAGVADGATRDEQGSAAAAPGAGAAQPREVDPGLGLAPPALQARGAPLVGALDHHSREAREHAEGTASYAFAAAVEIGFGRAQAEAVRWAAMLHGAGQNYAPAVVLAEVESERYEADMEAFEAHYEAGYRLARRAGVPEHVCDWLLRVRERYDGAGPEGLPGEAIPIESRIIRAACVCQAALAEQVGPGRQSHGRVVEHLNARSGDQLDPRVVAALVALIERASAAE